MTVFVLKIIAVLSMLTDHIAYMLTLALNMNTPLIFNMRAVGRIAFPIYAFLLVNGFEKTRNKGAYMERLFLFALISQIPFSLTFSPKNYMSAGLLAQSSLFFKAGWPLNILLVSFVLPVFFFVVYERRLQRGLCYTGAALLAALVYAEVSGIAVLGMGLNVFYTLAVSFAVIWALDELINRRGTRSLPELFIMAAACAALAVCVLPGADYGFKGLVLIAALYLAGKHKAARLAVTAVWAWWMYGYSPALLVGALAACIPIVMYNGRLGKKMKMGFYLIYPVHLTILFFVGLILS